MFSCSDDRSVKMFDITSASLIASFNHHEYVFLNICVCSAPVTSIDLSSKSILASCGMDRFVYFVDTRVSDLKIFYQLDTTSGS